MKIQYALGLISFCLVSGEVLAAEEQPDGAPKVGISVLDPFAALMPPVEMDPGLVPPPVVVAAPEGVLGDAALELPSMTDLHVALSQVPPNMGQVILPAASASAPEVDLLGLGIVLGGPLSPEEERLVKTSAAVASAAFMAEAAGDAGGDFGIEGDEDGPEVSSAAYALLARAVAQGAAGYNHAAVVSREKNARTAEAIQRLLHTFGIENPAAAASAGLVWVPSRDPGREFHMPNPLGDMFPHYIKTLEVVRLLLAHWAETGEIPVNPRASAQDNCMLMCRMYQTYITRLSEASLKGGSFRSMQLEEAFEALGESVDEQDTYLGNLPVSTVAPLRRSIMPYMDNIAVFNPEAGVAANMNALYASLCMLKGWYGGTSERSWISAETPEAAKGIIEGRLAHLKPATPEVLREDASGSVMPRIRMGAERLGVLRSYRPKVLFATPISSLDELMGQLRRHEPLLRDPELTIPDILLGFTEILETMEENLQRVERDSAAPLPEMKMKPYLVPHAIGTIEPAAIKNWLALLYAGRPILKDMLDPRAPTHVIAEILYQTVGAMSRLYNAKRKAMAPELPVAAAEGSVAALAPETSPGASDAVPPAAASSAASSASDAVPPAAAASFAVPSKGFFGRLFGGSSPLRAQAAAAPAVSAVPAAVPVRDPAEAPAVRTEPAQGATAPGDNGFVGVPLGDDEDALNGLVV